MSKNTFKVGDKVKLISVNEADANVGGFKVGEKVEVVVIDQTDSCLDVQVSRSDGTRRWFNHEALVLRVKNKATAAKPEMSWPWPAGTKVRLLPGAFGYAAEKAGVVYTLWHDGSDYPPVVSDENKFFCFVCEGYVELAE
jgi:hypothetical protein